ncbi:CUB domain-containing protein 2-like, partial [Saccoglossus kowalevskii]
NDYLEIGNGDDVSDKSSRFMFVTGSDYPHPFTTYTDEMWMRFVSDQSIVRRGFHVVLAEDTSCVSNIVIQPGRNTQITSPDFPYPYDNDLFCQWNISSESGGNIRVNILVFDTEKLYDWVDIGSGFDSTDLRTRLLHVSGSLDLTEGSTFNTGSSELWMTFTTDPDNGGYYLGFNMWFTDDGCVTEYIDDTYGQITSPLYNSFYPHNSDCVWIIDYKEGWEIHLTFNDFELEEHYDKLLVGSGTDPNSDEFT